ncbi:MAG: hypothetical protein ACR2P0_05325 [Acidimicrobiales bacterium]
MNDGLDGGSGEVRVPLADAEAGRLPAICAISGKKAGGAAPMRLSRSLRHPGGKTIRVPLSDAVFTRWSRRQNIHIKARTFASILTALAVVVAFRNGFLAIGFLAAAVAVHLLDLWAERTSRDLRPEAEREKDQVVLRGVHPRFIDAVERR